MSRNFTAEAQRRREKIKKAEELNDFSQKVLEASLAVHKSMGPGLLESVYHHCLVRELTLRHVRFRSLTPVPLIYKGHFLNKDYVIDILVEDEIIVELKAMESILPTTKRK